MPFSDNLPAVFAGLYVAPVKISKAAGKDVLVMERFDRTYADNGWFRKSMISTLTMFALSDMTARYPSYEDFQGQQPQPINDLF